jgi:two-component system NtrC family response regulator
VIPPLRERPDDIELLTRHFVERFSEGQTAAPPALDRRFLDILCEHPWPGNVRELEKTLQRALVLAHGSEVLRPEQLPLEIAGRDLPQSESGAVVPLRETLAAVECREIKRALRRAKGNKSLVSRELKISYPNLLKKIKLYGISLP